MSIELDDASEMPIPFGISEDGSPLPGINNAALRYLIKTDSDNGLSNALEGRRTKGDSDRGVIGDIRDPNNLQKTGWGVIFAPSVTDDIKRALKPLLDHRGIGRDGYDSRLFKVLKTPGPKDSAERWLLPIRLDTVNPRLGVPYYVLIVGPPHEISFEFQYGLDLYWAVGRIWFDTVEEFARYAQSVVDYETKPEMPTARSMGLFATRKDGDEATQALYDSVAVPMTLDSDEWTRVGSSQDFDLRTSIGSAATRENLENFFRSSGANKPPALLFSGTHGLAVPATAPERQKATQGAIACADSRVDASVISQPNFKPFGMIHFLFACYGGGWPATDTYCNDGSEPQKISDLPMLARFPQALLAHQNGGALAVLAHVDRAWGYSFRKGKTPQLQGFRDVIGKILNGDRIGQATDEFNKRWAVLSGGLAEALKPARTRDEYDPKILANRWVARDDARNYIVIGDPAVRLRVEDMPVAKATEAPAS